MFLAEQYNIYCKIMVMTLLFHSNTLAYAFLCTADFRIIKSYMKYLK